MNRFFLAASALSLLASAGIAHAAPRWTNDNVKVKNIMWRPDLKGFYAEGGTYHNPDGCSNSTSNFYELSSAVTSDSERSRRLSIILTAKTDGSKLNVWVDGCGSIGPLFTGVQINP